MKYLADKILCLAKKSLSSESVQKYSQQISIKDSWAWPVELFDWLLHSNLSKVQKMWVQTAEFPRNG